MESDSDEDFMSADEGDEEISEISSVISEVVQESSKADVLLKDEKEKVDEAEHQENVQMHKNNDESKIHCVFNPLEHDKSANCNIHGVIGETPDVDDIPSGKSNSDELDDENIQKSHTVLKDFKEEEQQQGIINQYQIEDGGGGVIDSEVRGNIIETKIEKNNQENELLLISGITNEKKLDIDIDNEMDIDIAHNCVSGNKTMEDDLLVGKTIGTKESMAYKDEEYKEQLEDIPNLCQETKEDCIKHSFEEQLMENLGEDNENIEADEPKKLSIDKLTLDENKAMKCERKDLGEISTHSEVNESIEHDVANGWLEKEVSVDLPSENIAGNDIENKASKNTCDQDNVSTISPNTDESTDDSWGWDSWADNFISQATTKVTTLMETVEEQLGIPDPALLAQNMKVEVTKIEDKKEESLLNKNSVTDEDNIQTADTQQKENISSWFSSFVPVASITNIVQSTGQELVSGGIDALEFIGKSTVTYLSDGDPGLRNKRKAFFKQEGLTLSSVLLEAKSKAEQKETSGLIPKGEDPKKLNDMLEKFQAIAHLDALQMLSSNCETKLKRIMNVQSELAKDDSIQILTSIKENFELEESEECNLEDVDFKKEVYAFTKMLKIKVTCSKLLNTWSKIKEKTDVINFENSEKCFENCISSLAELISRCIEYYRKVADMLIMTDFQAKQLAVERATVLKSVSEMFQYEVSGLSNKFANYLANDNEDKKASDFITDIYLESANCSSLLQDSHMLLLPILQCSAIK